MKNEEIKNQAVNTPIFQGSKINQDKIITVLLNHGVL